MCRYIRIQFVGPIVQIVGLLLSQPLESLKPMKILKCSVSMPNSTSKHKTPKFDFGELWFYHLQLYLFTLLKFTGST